MKANRGQILDRQTDNSRALYVMKAFAILFVVFAHCVYREPPMVQKITELLGIIAVPIFLMISGIFFKAEEPGRSFWKKKFKGLVVPWLIWGVVTYFIAVVLGRPCGLLEMLRWCIGHGTWLYYVTILLFYYVVFRAIKWRGTPYVMIAIWIVSNVLDVFELNLISNAIGDHLNAFSRIGFFAIGVLLGRFGILKWQPPRLWAKIVFPVTAVGAGVLVVAFDETPVEVYLLRLFFVMLACVSLFICSQGMSDCRLLQNVGQQTYLIYFLHMQLGIGLAGKLIGLFSLPTIAKWGILVVQPVLVVSLVYTGIIVLDLILTKLRLEKYEWIIGMRHLEK